MKKSLLVAIFLLALMPTVFAQNITLTIEPDSCFTEKVSDLDSCALAPAYTLGDTSFFLSNQHAGQSMSPEACLSQVQVTPPIICAGDTATMTGSLVSGGNATYHWSTGENTKVIKVWPQFTTTYTVTVTETNTGCTSTVTPIVFVSGIKPQLLLVPTPASCNNSGAIDLTVTDNNPAPYNYMWSNGTTMQDPINLVPGTYSVTVSDSEGCKSMGYATVTNGGGNLNLSTTTTNPTCNGGTNGSVNLTVSGGSGNYTYAWSNGSTMEDPSGLAAGTYTVTVTSGACMGTTLVTITQPAPPTLSVSVNPMQICTGQTATLTIVNACGTTTMPVSPCATTTYPATFTDLNGCTANASTTLTVVQCGTPPSLSVTNTTATCVNATTGMIDLSVTGGVAPYIYAWSNGATTQDPSNLSAGTYTVTVTGGNGMTSTISATVGLNALPTANFTFSVSGLTVTFTNQSTGATTFAWALGNGLFSNDINPVYTYTQPGTYDVVLVAFGPCGQATKTQTITVCMLPTASFSVNTSGPTATFTNSSTGATSYSWDFGDGTTSAQTNPQHTYTATGDYNVVLTATNNCGSITTMQMVSVCIPAVVLIEPAPIVYGTELTTPVELKVVVQNQSQHTILWSSPSGYPLGDPDAWAQHISTVWIGEGNSADFTWVVDPNGNCPVTGNTTVEVVPGVSGISDDRGGPQPVLSPNPTTGHFDISNLPTGVYNVTIFDQSGRIVSKKVIKE